MGEYDLCVNLNYGWGADTQTQTQTNKKIHRHINTMTWPGRVKIAYNNNVYVWFTAILFTEPV